MRILKINNKTKCRMEEEAGRGAGAGGMIPASISGFAAGSLQ